MKFRMINVIQLVLLLIIPLSYSCESKSTTSTQQIVTVQKGTLSVTVAASGNLALSKTADLAFDVSGYVYKVLVKAGDEVKEGQVVAEIDSYDWEKQKKALQAAVIQSKISLNNAIIALEKAQNPTTTTSTISGSISAPDPLDIETKNLSVDQAKISVETAQQELDRYLLTSSQIKATFDGIVTTVNVKGGDEIFKGSVAVSIADPNKFGADILVSELDINSIKVGQSASVQLASSSTSKFSANVTSISPTATNSSGVVSYKVRVELLSADDIKQLQTTQSPISNQSQSVQSQTGQSPTGQAPAGQPSFGQPPAGQPTTGPSQPTQSSNRTTAASSQTASSALTLADLREGFSVTITLTTQEKQNVLMLLSKAISKQGTDKIVKIPNGDKVEIKVIKTGISNSTYTEITEGLNEGDKVAIVTATSTTSTSTTKSTTTTSPSMGGMGGPPPF